MAFSRRDKSSDVVQRQSSADRSPTPGKRTLTDALQMRSDGAPGPATDGAEVQAIANTGVADSGGTLPHLDAIQRSFGSQHDVTSIQAHVGGPAAEASQRIGAEAYATGDQVAFRQTPSLHTAAHEAAHVVQQRQGVQLKGGVGQEGDTYERNADAVADRVVAGQSAADLLPQPAGSGGAGVQAKAGEAVQRVRIGYSNTDTERKFVLDTGSGPNFRASMSETSGGKQRGNAHFEIKKSPTDGAKVMTLHTINATPEEGSGLGTVFMYYMAMEALKGGCVRIEIDDAAVSAVGFYVHMGAKSSNPELQQGIYEQLTSEDRIEYESNKGLDDMASESAQREHERDNYEKDDYTVFDNLPEKDKKQKRLEKRQQLGELNTQKGGKLAADRLKHRALSMSGLIADPNDMLKQTMGSMAKRWQIGEVEVAEDTSSDKKSSSSSNGKKGNDKRCFLTTACMEARGLPDDCAELEVLRAFRDGYMRTQPGGAEAIAAYYRIAPPIVAAIAREERAQEIYDDLFVRLVRRSIALIEDHREAEALAHYRDFVLELERIYLTGEHGRSPVSPSSAGADERAMA